MWEQPPGFTISLTFWYASGATVPAAKMRAAARKAWPSVTRATVVVCTMLLVSR
jgi:hypothetical protein